MKTTTIKSGVRDLDCHGRAARVLAMTAMLVMAAQAAFAAEANDETASEPTAEQVAAAWSCEENILTNSVSGWAFKINGSTLSSVLPSLTNILDSLSKDLDMSALDGDHEFENMQKYKVTSTGELFQGAPNTLKAAVERVIFPKTLTTIGEYAFCSRMNSNFKFIGCPNLSFVVFPKGLTTINGYAFLNCSKASFDFGGSSPSSVGLQAFSGTMLSEVAFTNTVSLRSTNGGGFQSAGSLKRVELPQVTSIPLKMFQSCSALERLIIPNVTSLGSSFISGTSKLKALKLPWCMKPVESGAFSGEKLSNLLVHHSSPMATQGKETIATNGGISQEKITFYGGTTQDGWIYDDAVWNEETKMYDIQSDIVTIVAAPSLAGGTLTEPLEIPKTLTIEVRDEQGNPTGTTTSATVTAIEACAFKKNEGLTCVTVPKTVTRIGVAAFPEGCYIKIKDSPHAQGLVGYLNDWYKTDADGKPYASIDNGSGLMIIVK